SLLRRLRDELFPAEVAHHARELDLLPGLDRARVGDAQRHALVVAVLDERDRVAFDLALGDLGLARQVALHRAGQLAVGDDEVERVRLRADLRLERRAPLTRDAGRSRGLRDELFHAGVGHVAREL